MYSVISRIPPVALGLFYAVAAWLFSISVPIWHFNWAWSGVVAAILAAFAFFILANSLRQFVKHKTTADPITPEKATTLVVSGLYRFTRNPMYLGFSTFLMSWGVYLGALSALLVVPVFMVNMTHMQIKREERVLLDRFGDDYLSYMRSVRRWI